MQDAIILYENGKAIGGEGHPTDADDITFDNTGTDIVANKVGSAIKEVNAKTQHGLVELWKNSSPSSDFAGQTIQIANFDTTKYDAVIIAIGSSSEVFVPRWSEIDTDFIGSSFTHVLSSMSMDSNLDWIYLYKRTVTLTLNGTTLSLAFSDCTITTNKGGAITNTTGNGVEVPIRILGLIHND